MIAMPPDKDCATKAKKFLFVDLWGKNLRIRIGGRK